MKKKSNLIVYPATIVGLFFKLICSAAKAQQVLPSLLLICISMLSDKGWGALVFTNLYQSEHQVITNQLGQPGHVVIPFRS